MGNHTLSKNHELLFHLGNLVIAHKLYEQSISSIPEKKITKDSMLRLEKEVALSILDYFGLKKSQLYKIYCKVRKNFKSNLEDFNAFEDNPDKSNFYKMFTKNKPDYFLSESFYQAIFEGEIRQITQNTYSSSEPLIYKFIKNYAKDELTDVSLWPLELKPFYEQAFQYSKLIRSLENNSKYDFDYKLPFDSDNTHEASVEHTTANNTYLTCDDICRESKDIMPCIKTNIYDNLCECNCDDNHGDLCILHTSDIYFDLNELMDYYQDLTFSEYCSHEKDYYNNVHSNKSKILSSKKTLQNLPEDELNFWAKNYSNIPDDFWILLFITQFLASSRLESDLKPFDIFILIKLYNEYILNYKESPLTKEDCSFYLIPKKNKFETINTLNLLEKGFIQSQHSIRNAPSEESPIIIETLSGFIEKQKKEEEKEREEFFKKANKFPYWKLYVILYTRKSMFLFAKSLYTSLMLEEKVFIHNESDLNLKKAFTLNTEEILAFLLFNEFPKLSIFSERIQAILEKYNAPNLLSFFKLLYFILNNSPKPTYSTVANVSFFNLNTLKSNELKDNLLDFLRSNLDSESFLENFKGFKHTDVLDNKFMDKFKQLFFRHPNKSHSSSLKSFINNDDQLALEKLFETVKELQVLEECLYSKILSELPNCKKTIDFPIKIVHITQKKIFKIKSILKLNDISGYYCLLDDIPIKLCPLFLSIYGEIRQSPLLFLLYRDTN